MLELSMTDSAVAAVVVTEALLELLDATFGVDEALLTGEERVVARPYVNGHLGLRAVGLEYDLALAVDLAGHPRRVDVPRHLTLLAPGPAPLQALQTLSV